jgi:3-hydroxyisobutyrate dehydrogenase
MKIAFLGLGRMGRELVNHLLDAGHDVTVWNRTESATAGAAARGARVAHSPAEAIDGAEVVLTMFFGPDVIREVITSQNPAFAAGALWIDLTTIAPDDAEEFATWADDQMIRHVYSPVIGTVKPAHERALTVLLGGNPDAVAAARPIVSLWAAEGKIRTFATARQASTAKLIANLSLAVAAEGVAEALRLGTSADFTTQEVLDLLPLTLLASLMAAKGSIVRDGSWVENSSFTVDALAKDIRFMTTASTMPLPAAEAFAALLAGASAAGLGDADFTAALQDDISP